VVSGYTVNHLGRKTVYLIMIGMTTAGCLIAAFIEDGTGKTALCMVGEHDQVVKIPSQLL